MKLQEWNYFSLHTVIKLYSNSVFMSEIVSKSLSLFKQYLVSEPKSKDQIKVINIVNIKSFHMNESLIP